MCQLGAIGRAQRGAGYREILGWYYSGAAPERVY
jgi:peptidoglycan hydrolase-like amidase